MLGTIRGCVRVPVTVDQLAAGDVVLVRSGGRVLYLVVSDAVAGPLALEDEVRPEARRAVRDLQAMGPRLVTLTGVHEARRGTQEYRHHRQGTQRTRAMADRVAPDRLALPT